MRELDIRDQDTIDKIDFCQRLHNVYEMEELLREGIVRNSVHDRPGQEEDPHDEQAASHGKKIPRLTV